MTSPTQRTMKWLRDRGYIAAVVEKWNPHVKRPDGGRGMRQDLFGFCDILVLGYDGYAVAWFQVTSGSGHAARREKILESEKARDVAAVPGNGIFVQSWSKKEGGRQKWFPRTEEVHFE